MNLEHFEISEIRHSDTKLRLENSTIFIELTKKFEFQSIYRARLLVTKKMISYKIHMNHKIWLIRYEYYHISDRSETGRSFRMKVGEPFFNPLLHCFLNRLLSVE